MGMLMDKMFKEHMEYIAKHDIEGMVNNTFTDDAVLAHNFRFFKGEPPYISRGKKEILETEKVMFDPKNQGKVIASKPFNVVEEKDFLAFQVTIESGTGKYLMSDTWIIRDGKIAICYSMGYFLGK